MDQIIPDMCTRRLKYTFAIHEYLKQRKTHAAITPQANAVEKCPEEEPPPTQR